MSVYVDDMRAEYGNLILCHMISDSHDELISMVDSLGISRDHIQKPNSPWEHFDICLTKRAEAVRLGAIEVTQREVVEMIRMKKAELRKRGRKPVKVNVQQLNRMLARQA